MAQFYYDPEKLGRRRLPDNKQYRADLQGRSDLLLSALQDLVASNYPKTPNSNLGILYRTLGREFARLQQSVELINNDKIFTQTRIEYIQQILGERLFLGERITPTNYSDVSYREYLIAIKDAYLSGSSKQNIESIVERFTKQQINLKEIYLESRKPASAYGLIDTHKMVLEVFVDDILNSGKDLASLTTELNFFINLVRPAHVLYDTKFIWTERFDINKIHDLFFGDTGGGCIPIYLYKPFDEVVVLGRQILVVEPPSSVLLTGPSLLPSNPTGNIHRISSIHSKDQVIYLENGTKVVVEPGVDGTQIFGVNGKRILFENLQIGQYIRLTSLTIPGDFQFYWLPPDLVTDYNSRFYKGVFRKPAFQEFVKKLMDRHGRFPVQVRTTDTTLCDRWVQDALQPMYEDLRKNCQDLSESKKSYTVSLAERMWSPRFAWENIQGASLGREKTGDIFSFTMPYAPLTDGSGGTATPVSIGVLKGLTPIYDAVRSVDSSSSYISLNNTSEYWDSSAGGVPITGQELTFNYYYKTGLSDSTASTTCLFGVAQWQLPNVPVSNGSGTNTLALPSDVKVSVDGTYIPDAVAEINPILGHVTLQYYRDFWLASPLGRTPTIGDQINFDYYESGTSNYSMLWDDIARDFDDDMIFDGAEGASDPTRTPAPKYDPLTIGYKYRADLLHHASVLNSPDTLLLNNYQKPATRSSIVNRQDNLNHFNYFFSPEHLYDKSSQIILNDKYLDQPNDPILKLGSGTPPFQKTYSYQPDLIHQRKLQNVRKHHHPLMYTDLLLKEYRYGNESVTLSSICDQARYSFKTRFKEDLNKLKECESWMLFDTAVIDLQNVTIPSEVGGVINLRVASKKLRKNFVLRETSPNNVSSNTYSVYMPIDAPLTVFYLPETIPYRIGSDTIDFPALPAIKDFNTLATADDVVVKLRGDVVHGLIKSFDPVTGYVEIFNPENYIVNSFVQLTQRDIDLKFVSLPSVPLRPDLVLMGIYRGSPQEYGVDFFVIGDTVYWNTTPLESILEAGDVIRFSYPVYALRDATISFTYNIRSVGLARVMDRDRSRVFDWEHVFPAQCFDGFENTLKVQFNEYVNYLSDYSSGIKFTYFNKDTYQIEEHVFTGPVFESYDPHDDEISSPESFPNALVKIRNPLNPANPLNLLTNYGYINEPSVRIRKKTIRELLPDRSFRTSKIMEVLPV
jgi:hypothetical protein